MKRAVRASWLAEDLTPSPLPPPPAGRKNGQDARWLQQVRRSGTTSDKVAALTLLLQESAVANLRSLDALLNWVIKRKGGRNVVAQVRVALCLRTSRKINVVQSHWHGCTSLHRHWNVQHHLTRRADNLNHCTAVLPCFGFVYVHCVLSL